jgi:hypothetical protein
MCITVFARFVSLPLLLRSDHQRYSSVCVPNLRSCLPETNTLQSLIHDYYITANCFTIYGKVFWYVLSFCLYLLQSCPNLYNWNTKHYTTMPEMAHIKWISNNDEHSTGLWYLQVTSSSYITLTEDIKLCFRTLSNNNKTVNTTVYNKHKYCCNCYMLQPETGTNRQEEYNFSEWEINQRFLSLCDLYLVYLPHTLLTHTINI